MPSTSENKSLKSELSRIKILLPTILGLGVICYLFWDDLASVGDMHWSWNSVIAILVAAVLVVIRELAYTLRIKTLSMGKLSWGSSLNSVLLWEFASSVTPTVIGGSAFAVLILKREGLSVGRSLATVLVTVVMDELFYVISVPLVVICVGIDSFFPEFNGVQTLFYTGYIITFVISVVILSALFISPVKTRAFVLRIFQLPLLNKLKSKAELWTEDWVIASDSLKGAPKKIWIISGGATIVSWSARFLTLNAILYAFIDVVPNGDIIARQLGMWIVLLLSPTPGASGIAEGAMPMFIEPVVCISAFGIVVLFWRFFTYYIYLIVGALILPRWLARTSDKNKLN
jgi:uncharacterized protein (TIRG00374 family)